MKAILLFLFAVCTAGLANAEELPPKYKKFVDAYSAAAADLDLSAVKALIYQDGHTAEAINQTLLLLFHAAKFRPEGITVRRMEDVDPKPYADVEREGWVYGYRPKPTAVVILNYPKLKPSTDPGWNPIRSAPLVEVDGKVYLAVMGVIRRAQ